MKEMLYKAQFTFTDDTLPESIRSAAIDEFMKRRQFAVNLINPCYEEWNAEFNRMYPDKNGYSEEYEYFIAKKHEYYLEKANRQTFGLDLIKLINNPECTGDIAAEFRMFNNAKIYLTLVEYKEEEL